MKICRLLFGLVCLLVMASPAYAGFYLPERATASDANMIINSDRQVVKSSGQASQLVKRKYGGKILKVQTQGNKGRISYVVKVLKDNGKIFSVNVDANTGKLSRR